jgi:hypothetical protein
MERSSDGSRLLDLLRRREILIAECLTSESTRGLYPLVVCHHPQLPVTSDDEIRAARSSRQPIIHVRVERSESGVLLAMVERELDGSVKWSREEDAPLTHVSVVDLEAGTRKVVMLPAKFGAGCGMAGAEL